MTNHFTDHFQYTTKAPTTTDPISNLGTSNYSPNYPTTSNFTPENLALPTKFHHHSQFHTLAHPINHQLPSTLPISHMGTSNHPPTLWITSSLQPSTSHCPPNFTTTPNFPPGHLQSPSHFPITANFTSGHIQLPTHLPHHIPIYTWTPPIISNFTPGHLPLPTQFQHHS